MWSVDGQIGGQVDQRSQTASLQSRMQMKIRSVGTRQAITTSTLLGRQARWGRNDRRNLQITWKVASIFLVSGDCALTRWLMGHLPIDARPMTRYERKKWWAEGQLTYPSM